MNKKIMILGAAANQVPLITTAKDLGYEIIVCDWTTDNPGITMAPYSPPPPGAKVDGIEIIKKSGEKINRCTCALDVIGFVDFEFDDIDSQRCVYNKLNDFCHIKLK